MIDVRIGSEAQVLGDSVDRKSNICFFHRERVTSNGGIQRRQGTDFSQTATACSDSRMSGRLLNAGRAIRVYGKHDV